MDLKPSRNRNEVDESDAFGRSNEFNKTRPKYVLFTLWLMRDDHWIPVIHPLIHAGLMTYMCFPLVNRTDSDDHMFSQNHRRVTQSKVYTFPGWWFVRHYFTYTTWPLPWFARMIFTHPTCNQWFIGIRIGFTTICPNRETFLNDKIVHVRPTQLIGLSRVSGIFRFRSRSRAADTNTCQRGPICSHIVEQVIPRSHDLPVHL